jgi:hypothetical protein
VVTYPDPATLLVAWATATITGLTNACTEVPTNLVQTLAAGPTHVIERFGGTDPLPGVDVATIAVDTYAGTRAGAITAAETLRRALREQQGRAFAGVRFSRVATISAPTRRPFGSRSVVLVGASYQLTLHCPT